MSLHKDIYIVRHGQTEYNRLGKVQGQGVDAPLNEVGRRQAAAVYRHYQHIDFDLVITSELQRTWQTVAAFIDAGIPWLKEPALNEISWGEQEGKSSTPESHAAYRRLVTAWDAGQYDSRMPGGESAQELGDRMMNFVQRLAQIDAQRILICSHGRAMRALMCALQDRPLCDMSEFQHDNAGLWVYHYRDGRYRVERTNDVSHLDGDVT